jgi:hypothetical protein
MQSETGFSDDRPILKEEPMDADENDTQEDPKLAAPVASCCGVEAQLPTCPDCEGCLCCCRCSPGES